MPRFRLLLFLSFAYFQSAYAKCTVINQETKEPAHCVFPFRDKYDKFYTNCTNFKDPEERYWCSTKNDENGTQIPGHWGYCDAAESDCGLYPYKATQIIKANECGIRLSVEFIVGGNYSKLGEFPYMALLGYQIDYKILYTCGGSVINSKYVLTAAHCHSCEQPIKQVLIGEHTLSKNPDCRKSGDFCLPEPQKLQIEKVSIHPNWNRSAFYLGYDIALVRVKGRIHLFGMSGSIDSYVLPVCLPWSPEKPGYFLKPREKLTATGWGQTNQKENERNYDKFNAKTDVLQKVKLPVLDSEVCKEDFNKMNDTLQFCAGAEDGKDTCNGDSGGPIVYETNQRVYYQVGIVSFGSKDCGGGKPAIYTRISTFLKWIEDSLEP